MRKTHAKAWPLAMKIRWEYLTMQNCKTETENIELCKSEYTLQNIYNNQNQYIEPDALSLAK